MSLMSITGIERLENIWSNIYAYYLNENESHGLGRVFLTCLERLIEEKCGRKLDLSGGVIKREVTTNRGNRIDLLIQASGNSVIIENKVHHVLDNDLQDYWLSIYGHNESKIGVILTLRHTLINDSNYINIIHTEWLSAVQKEIQQNSGCIESSALLMLDDFIENVKEVAGTINEIDVKFYLDNRLGFNELNKIVTDYRSWLQTIFTDKTFIGNLGGFSLIHNDWAHSKERFAMYRYRGIDKFVITIFYESLWNSAPNKARIYLYLQPLDNWLEIAISRKKEICAIAADAGVPAEEPKSDYWHCACQEICVHEDELLNEKAIKMRLAEYLANPESGIMIAASKIVDVLSKNHNPSYQWNDAIYMLKCLLPEDNEDNVAFWMASIDFKLYDHTNHIVVLEVTDNIFRTIIERDYGDSFMVALKYTFGEDARYTILCRQLMY